MSKSLSENWLLRLSRCTGATDNSTIHYLLHRSLSIKGKLGFYAMVCVYDQAIFVEPVEMQFKDKEKFKSLVLVMGEFHTLMMFLGVIGTRFKDSGLRDILLQSGVLADGSAEQAMTGSMYKRSIRMCKLMHEMEMEMENKCDIYQRC